MLSKQMSGTSASRRWIEKAGGSERTIRLGRKRKGVRLCAKTTKLHGSQKEGSCACYTGSTEFLQAREQQPHQLFRKAEKIEVCSLVPLRIPLHELYKRAQTHTHAENAKKTQNTSTTLIRCIRCMSSDAHAVHYTLAGKTTETPRPPTVAEGSYLNFRILQYTASTRPERPKWKATSCGAKDASGASDGALRFRARHSTGAFHGSYWAVSDTA